jgi:septum formation protein
MLELDGHALGKPGSVAAARERWHEMRGRTGVLHTGHCIVDTATGRSATSGADTEVRFADVTDAEIDAYGATGEPTAVAGAFTIDGLGGWFVDGVVGDPHNVVGVSLPLVRRLLHELGRSLADVGYPPGQGAG